MIISKWIKLYFNLVNFDNTNNQLMIFLIWYNKINDLFI